LRNFLRFVCLAGLVEYQTGLAGAVVLSEAAHKTPPLRARAGLAKSLAHYTMGLVYDNETRIAEAVKEYSKALEYNNKEPEIYMRLGVDCLVLGDYKKAVEALRAAKRFNADDARPRILLALAYTELKKLSEAQREYEEIIKINPGSLQALGSLADLYVLGRKLNEAAVIYEEMLAKNSDKKNEAMLHFNLGIIYAKMNRLDDALLQLEEAVKLDDGNPEIYLALAVLYEANKKKDQAVKKFSELLNIDPRDTGARRLLAYLYLEHRQLRQAIGQFEAIIRIEPDDPGAYIDLAV
jgi:tetratricopeptide (TPR) repeat protein